jgi:hypothetical protein
MGPRAYRPSLARTLTAAHLSGRGLDTELYILSFDGLSTRSIPFGNAVSRRLGQSVPAYSSCLVLDKNMLRCLSFRGRHEPGLARAGFEKRPVPAGERSAQRADGVAGSGQGKAQEQGRGIAVNRLRRAPATDVIPSPCPSFFSRSASVALPGPRGRTSSADGLQLAGVLSASAAEAVRGCSPTTSTADCATTTTKESIS